MTRIVWKKFLVLPVLFGALTFFVHGAGFDSEGAALAAERAPKPNQPAPAKADPKEAWGLKAIRAAEAWKTTRGRSETVIAVIDDGVLEKHEQVESRIVSPRSVNSVTGRQAGYPNHGTAVAVVAAGRTLGVCPACSVMPLQVQAKLSRGILEADIGSSNDMMTAIYRAIEAGAKVVNMSIATRFGATFYGKGGRWRRGLLAPLRAAEEAGVTVVIAAGNEGVDVSGRVSHAGRTVFSSYQGNGFCSTPYSLCVGGVGLDPSGNVVPYKNSNHGPEVNVSAPAVEVSTGAADSRQAYTRDTGTSYAAPHVAGLAGLIASAKPDLRPRDIRYAIIASAAGDKAVEKKLRWTVDEEAQEEDLRLWARAYFLLRGETKAPDKLEERLKQILLSLIPAAYAERWYYPEVVIPEGGNTIQGKAVGGLIDAPRALSLARKLPVPVAPPTLDGEQARLAVSIPIQDLVRLYELARLEESYAGSFDPEGLADIVGPFELRIAKPFDRLEVVRPKSPGKSYSERLEFLAPGSFRHLATLDGRDYGQGTVEVKRLGDFLFLRNPKSGARLAYQSTTRTGVGSRGIMGAMAKLLGVFDAHPRSVSPYSPSPFCTIAGCEAGVVKVGLFAEYEDRSYLLPGAVSVFSGTRKVAEGSGSGPGFAFVLPAGAYRLRVADPLGPGWEQELDIAVAAGQEVRRDVVFPKGLLSIRTLDSAGKPREANVEIYSGKKKLTYSWGGTQFGFFLSAGAYTARIEDREPGSAVRTNLDVAIETGKTLARDVKLARGTLHLRTFETGGKPLTTSAKIFRGDALWETKLGNQELKLALTPGSYRVVVREGSMSLRAGEKNAPSAEAMVTIENGKTTTQDLTVHGGTLALRSLMPDGKPVSVYLQVFSGDKAVISLHRTEEKFFLAPGDYRIKIEKKTGSATMEAEARVTVEDGKSVQRDLTLPAGVLSIRPVDQNGKPVRADLRLYSGEKHVTTKYGDTSFEMLLPPGGYRVLVEAQKVKKELDVVIETGKTVRKDVTLP